MYLWKSGGNFIVKVVATHVPTLLQEGEEKEELKNLLKCGKFSFYVMVDGEVFTYLKNKKQLILEANKKFKIFKWNSAPCFS